MFGLFKRAYAETTVQVQLDGIKQLLSNHFGKIDPVVWHDQHIRAFAFGAIRYLLMVAHGKPIHPELMGFQIGRSWSYLTGLSAEEFIRSESIALAAGADCFVAAFEKGTLWASLATRTAKHEHLLIRELLDKAILDNMTSVPAWEKISNSVDLQMYEAASTLFLREFVCRMEFCAMQQIRRVG